MSRKRVAIIITLFCLFSALVLGYATMRGLRESGALSKYQLWVTNQTGQPLFVHTLSTPFMEDWEESDVENYGNMAVAQLLPGQTVHMMSSKLRNERDGRFVHPQRFFLLVDSNYRADSFGSYLLSTDPETGNPKLVKHTLENLLADFREVNSEHSHWLVTKDEQDLIQVERVDP